MRDTTLRHETAETPFVEEWSDADGNSARIARIDIGERDSQVFMRQSNQSGFRRSVDYLSAITGIALPEDERAGGMPIIMVTSQQGVYLFDGRPDEHRAHYLRKTEAGGMRHDASVPFGKDMFVGFGTGDTVFFGVMSPHAEGSEPDVNRPSFEFVRRVLAVCDEGQRQKKRLSRLFMRRP